MLYECFLLKTRMLNMWFAILMSMANDEFNMIKTHIFIIYILEYEAGKASFYCFL